MVALGLIPFNVVENNFRGWFDAASFTALSGRLPCCWEHWQHDDVVFTNEASYTIGRDGMLVAHKLDDSQPRERAIIADIQRGRQLGFSWGSPGTPEETRQVVTEIATGQATRPEAGAVVRGVTLGHMAYTARPAIEQRAIFLV